MTRHAQIREHKFVPFLDPPLDLRTPAQRTDFLTLQARKAGMHRIKQLAVYAGTSPAAIKQSLERLHARGLL